MDPKIGWYQPEQCGPAKDLWERLWEKHKPLPQPQPINNGEIGAPFQDFFLTMPGYSRKDAPPNRARTYGVGSSAQNQVKLAQNEGCPWLVPGKQYSRGVVGLHEEIEDFFNYMSPTLEEHSVRLLVVDRLKKCIKGLYPAAHVEIFGSFRTGLYLPTSDIDLVVLGHWDDLPGHMYALQQAIIDADIADSSTIKVIEKAVVPIVKLTDKRSDVKVDISFNVSSGVRAAELVKKYRSRFPALPKLVLVLKQYLLERDLNEVFTGGVSSYSLILMTISFLQLHPRVNAGSPAANLGVLLIEFFELYGRHFNYVNAAIRVKDGGSYIPKAQILSDTESLLRPSISFLCIEDPLTPGNDIGRGSFGALNVKDAFEFAYIVMVQGTNAAVTQGQSDLKSHSLLGRIIRITDEVISYRKWLRDVYRSMQHGMDDGDSYRQ